MFNALNKLKRTSNSYFSPSSHVVFAEQTHVTNNTSDNGI